jgi:AcrR family transcriptional regulator
VDRRILKTTEAIFEAFVGLMAEKNIEKITINEIADRANVNRGTVYLHFVDKYDLFNQCIETHLNQLFANCLPGQDLDDFSSKASMLRTFEYLEQNYFFYSTMLKNQNIPVFRNRLLAVAVHSLRRQFETSDINQPINQEVLV